MTDLKKRIEYFKSLSSDKRKNLFIEKAKKCHKITLYRKLYNQVHDKLSPELTIH